MATKKTIKEMFVEIMENYSLSAEHKDFIEGRIALCDKKSADRKPTEKQLKNKALSEQILDFLIEDGGSYTVADLIKKVPTLASMEETPSTSFVSALIKPLKDSGAVVRTEVKGRAYFEYCSDKSEDEGV